MKRSLTFALAVASLLFCSSSVYGQLFKNDGATVTVQSGAVLFIEGGVENTNSGTINNQGVIELEGDFDNAATYTGTGDTVIFSGADNAMLTSNGDAIGTMIIDKSATKTVSLQDDASIATELEFAADDNQVVLGTNDLRIQDGASIDSYDENEFVVTDDTGQLWIDSITNGETEQFPVGFSAATYNPFDVTVNSNESADNFGVRVQENALLDGTSGAVVSEHVVDASWVVEEGTVGGADYNVEAYWYGSDETPNFDETNSAVVRYDLSDMAWEGDAGDFGDANDGPPLSQVNGEWSEGGVFAVVSSLVNPTMTSNVELAIKVFLYGPYNNTSGMMGDALRDSNFIPTIEPYSAGPYNYEYKGLGSSGMVGSVADFDNVSDGDDIVDWIIVELRDAVEDTVIHSAPALLQRDGDVVRLDGDNNLIVGGVAPGDYYLAVGHRNHLKVRSADPLTLDGVSSANYDFTDALAKAYDNGAVTSNDAMFANIDGTFSLFGGDVNLNDKINYISAANDKSALLVELGGAGNVINDYSIFDVNMNGKVSYISAANDRTAILTLLGGAGNVVNAHVTN